MKKFILIIAVALFSVTSSYAYVGGQISGTNQTVTYNNVNKATIGYFLEVTGYGTSTISVNYNSGGYSSARVYSNQTKSGYMSKSGSVISSIFMEIFVSTGNVGWAIAQWTW